ncbi:MAG: hypothetical protein ACRD9S_08215 [Pyrinomonadaceae bacterium]
MRPLDMIIAAPIEFDHEIESGNFSFRDVGVRLFSRIEMVVNGNG